MISPVNLNRSYVLQHIRFIVVSRILCAVPLIFLYFSMSVFEITTHNILIMDELYYESVHLA